MKERIDEPTLRSFRPPRPNSKLRRYASALGPINCALFFRLRHNSAPEAAKLPIYTNHLSRSEFNSLTSARLSSQPEMTPSSAKHPSVPTVCITNQNSHPIWLRYPLDVSHPLTEWQQKAARRSLSRSRKWRIRPPVGAPRSRP